jgi:hypothetical protein
MAAYATQTGLPLKEVIADYPTGECWLAMGIMIDPVVTPVANGVFFSITTSNQSIVTWIGGLTRADILATYGQNKRTCVELIYRPATGAYKIFINGIQRASGIFSLLNTNAYPLSTQIVNFNSFATQETTTRMFITDFYVGVVDSIDDRLGNFKIQKLVAKNTTLNIDGMTPGGAAQLVTGDHTIEFDTAPVANFSVCGVVESVRAFSQGPTASVNTKRTLNGSETVARKAANMPTAIPTLMLDEIANQRVMATPQPYVTGTPLTECKLALSIVNN